jgi:hypothetical protein
VEIVRKGRISKSMKASTKGAMCELDVRLWSD